MKLSDAKFVFIDVETTGLSPAWGAVKPFIDGIKKQAKVDRAFVLIDNLPAAG